MTGKVALEGLTFHAYHGVYAHEQTNGNNFEVDIAVETDFSNGANDDSIHGTVDYEVLYKIVQQAMAVPSKLIETVAEKIVDNVLTQLPAVIYVALKIAKLNPPIGGSCQRASVTISKKR